MPSSTFFFFGNEYELSLLRDALDPFVYIQITLKADMDAITTERVIALLAEHILEKEQAVGEQRRVHSPTLALVVEPVRRRSSELRAQRARRTGRVR